MKKLLLANLAGFAISVTVAAHAADMPTKALPAPISVPPYNWSGFYIGANFGGAWTSGSLAIPDNNFYGGLSEFIGGVWISTVAGRVGLVEDRWLLYAKVGGGWVHSDATL